MSGHDDFAVEELPGLPRRPPPSERILWQGAPQWGEIAVRAFHVRKIVVWFAILMLWQAILAWQDGDPVGQAARILLFLGGLGLIAAGFFTLIAWAVQRTTIYTITSRRVVVRSGIALPMTVNIPFSVIERAAVRRGADGRGDVELVLRRGERIPALALWPHLRPWRLLQPRPMLRGIEHVDEVATLLTRAFLAATPEAMAVDASDKPAARPGFTPQPA